MKLIKNNLYLD